MASHSPPVCGFFFVPPGSSTRVYLPQVSVRAHTTIFASSSRTTLTQEFANPAEGNPNFTFDPAGRARIPVGGRIPELRYTFPLHDGATVVAFRCRIGADRVIDGVVRERGHAAATYHAAVAAGQTAGLLEQAHAAADIFTTSVGHVPAGASLTVEITYLAELKHDAEVDGLRFTIPTRIAPRYGSLPGKLMCTAAAGSAAAAGSSFCVVVDAEMAAGSAIRSVQSPSHPISVTIGTSAAAAAAEPDPRKASATLALASAELDKDFVLHVVATNLDCPAAVLETHPTQPHQRALMVTLVPKFALPPERPEIVFVCDRSGSMGHGAKMPNLVAALRIFLKSLPVGVKFNICSFGSRHSFLFPRSRPYTRETLAEAEADVAAFQSNYGGTEMFQPLEDTFRQRYADMNLDVFLITDGDIWNPAGLIDLIGRTVAESRGAVRVFTLGVGASASSSLVESVARAGNGFAQMVADNEKMDRKIVRMLRAALTPHVTDYKLEVRYAKEERGDKEQEKDGMSKDDAAPAAADDDDDSFELVEKVQDCLVLDSDHEDDDAVVPRASPAALKKPISLFNPNCDPDRDLDMPAGPAAKYAGVPAVPPPRILQAPHEIPPLFPFSRATVYLLFSPDSARRRPTSVLLRGTSQHGPLELEVPVTDAGRAETIHQLAARKATQELEEGRGWIFHARDRKGAGQLLRERHDGRFGDMVEREAVRLSVGFQVAGKWASFVAVESMPDGTKVELDGIKVERDGTEVERVVGVQPAAAAAPVARTTKSTLRERVASHMIMMSSAAPPSRPAQPAPPPPRQTLRGGATPSYGSPLETFQPLDAAWIGSYPTGEETAGGSGFGTSSVGGSGFGPASVGGSGVIGLASLGKRGPIQARPQAFATTAAPSASPYSSSRGALDSIGASYGAPQAKRKSAAAGLFGSAPGGNAGRHPSRSSPDHPGTNMDDDGSSNNNDAASNNNDTLAALIALQTWEGSWEWSPDLTTRLGNGTEAAAKTSIGQSGRAWAQALLAIWDQGGSAAAATACVLVFLRKHCAEDAESWEMVAEKARAWADLKLGPAGASVAELEEVLG